MALLSAEIESARPGYYQSHALQIYMAACAILSKTKQTFVMAEPAQGKTFVLFLIAEYAMRHMINEVQHDRVVIYSPTSIVIKQL